MPVLPPLAAVRVFEAAARHENFSRAAEELALTQAGVSYQIKVLEERLGVQLFQRKGRGMILTRLGRQIAPRVSEAFTALEDAFSMLRAENEAVLTITAPLTFATNWLAGRLGEFQMLRPELAVRLDVRDRVVDLSTGEFDVAIRGVEQPGEGVAAYFLMHQFVTPMATAGFLEQNPVCCPADVLSVPRVSPSDEWWAGWLTMMGLADPELQTRHGFKFDSQLLDGQAALAGRGVAMLCPGFYRQAIDSGQLKQLFPEHMLTDRRSFWMVCPEHKRRLNKVRAFHDWLRQALADSFGDDPLHPLLQKGS